MPDITMCCSKLCPSRNQCYRYRAIPSVHYQSYSDFFNKDGLKKCDHFLPIRDGDKLAPTIK